MNDLKVSSTFKYKHEFGMFLNRQEFILTKMKLTNKAEITLDLVSELLQLIHGMKTNRYFISYFDNHQVIFQITTHF